MNTEHIFTLVLIFAAVFCFGIFVFYVGQHSHNNSDKTWPMIFRLFSGGIHFFANETGFLFELRFPGVTHLFKINIARAGLSITPSDIYGASFFFGLLFLVIGFLSVSFLSMSLPLKTMLILFLTIAGAVYPSTYIQKIAEQRTNKILTTLPFAIDLITSSMNAGLDFNAAVRYLVDLKNDDNELRKEFTTFLKEVQLGKSRTEALKDMEKKIAVKEFSRFISSILHGIESGVSIIEVMKIQSTEIRRSRFAMAEQNAAKAPSKMIVPMAIFIFPSMFIIIFTPIILKLKDSPILSMLKW